MTQEEVHELFYYRDGHLYWKEDRYRNKTRDTKAGYARASDGRTVIRIDGKGYLAYRLVYLYFHGAVPEQVDHINGDVTDNRIDNLRPATPCENSWNQGSRKRNKLGIKNVSWNSQYQKYVVQMMVKGRSIFLGRYDDLELAELVAEEARDLYHGDFARG